MPKKMPAPGPPAWPSIQAVPASSVVIVKRQAARRGRRCRAWPRPGMRSEASTAWRVEAWKAFRESGKGRLRLRGPDGSFRARGRLGRLATVPHGRRLFVRIGHGLGRAFDPIVHDGLIQAQAALNTAPALEVAAMLLNVFLREKPGALWTLHGMFLTATSGAGLSAGTDGPAIDAVHPPRVSRVSFRLLRMQVKIGVSRSVYRLASAFRNSMTRSKKSSGLSDSNATTNSWSSRPNE